MKTGEASKSRTWFLLVFFLFTAGIISIGSYLYLDYSRNYRNEVEKQLSAIGNLKALEIVQWRKERLGDGNTFFKNPAFSRLVRRYFDNPQDTDARDQLQAWIGRFFEYYQYSRVSLFDGQGIRRMTLPDDAAPSPSAVFLRDIPEVLRTKKMIFQDFYRHDTDQRIYLAVLVPILDMQDTSRVLGVLALRIDPQLYLYPLLNRWPTPSKTAETLLVRREGSEVVFLNELRFQTNTALNMRAPLDRVSMPAVQAVLGKKGIMEGIDYRGTQVVAALHSVPGSEWFLIARMDSEEVYAPLQERLWVTIVSIAILFLGMGAFLWIFLQRQSVKVYKCLASQARRLASFVRDSNDAIIIHDFDGRISAWNRRAALMYGYSEAEALLANVELLSIPGKFAEENDFIRRLLENKEALSFETQRVSKDGRILDIWMTVTELTDEAGSPVCIVSTERDITARKREEKLLVDSELSYRRLFEAARDGILILNAETGMVIDVNPYLIELLGVSREVFLERHVWELGFFKDLIANEANFAELQQKGYARYEDMALEGHDGKRHEVEFISNSYLANDVKVIQCNIRDISDRVKTAKELKQSALDLEKKNVELERFLYSASHDLKSPVVTIRTFLGYLEQDMAGADAESIEQDLRFLNAATKKMVQLLENLLELSRIGYVVSEPVRVTLKDLGKETITAVAGQIVERGVAVKVSGIDVALFGDRLRLAEIWQNLVENACKFMGTQTEPCIEIGVEERGEERVFFVRDNGIGINPRYCTKIFDLFERLDPKAEGTGLGLALVKRIVELYAGRIWVESAGQGQGACFYFTLPGALNNQKQGETL